MKKRLRKLICSFLLALSLTTFLYWPIYQNIPLKDQNSNVDQEVKKLDLPLAEDIKEILDRSIQLPIDRHEICLTNKNGFHFIHSDSNINGIPLIFYTDDLNRQEFGKANKLGAMGINFYYQDNTSEVLLYREFGWPIECKKLEVVKLKKYASSTIEYSYVGLNILEDLDLGENGKVALLRAVVGGYSIDTSESSVKIIARWEFFLLTLSTLVVIFCGIHNLISNKIGNWYKKNIVPYLLNSRMDSEKIKKIRREVLNDAIGTVLEIGVGPGYNLPLYKNISRLYALEPSEELIEIAKTYKSFLAFPVEFIKIGAENITLTDKSIDTVVSTWTLCSVNNPRKVLQEINRVLKPEGKFIFMDHGSSPNIVIRFLQTISTSITKYFTGNCHYDRQLEKLIKEAGFSIEKMENSSERFKPLIYNYRGVAIKKIV